MNWLARRPTTYEECFTNDDKETMMPDETRRVRDNTDDVTGEKQPAVLTVQIKFNGPVNEDGLDHFTQLLDQELGHIRDVENQRIAPKNGKLGGGWGYGTSMVMDVERVVSDDA